MNVLLGRAEPPEAATQAFNSAFDVVVMAASLGGPEAIREIVRGLPPWFPAAVLIVQHRSPAAQDVTVKLLRGSTPLRVERAAEHDQPTPGVVHVLPADRQLVVGLDGPFRCLPGMTAGRTADPVLTSVAQRFGSRALGVILSGTNDDGAAGVIALRRAGTARLPRAAQVGTRSPPLRCGAPRTECRPRPAGPLRPGCADRPH